MKYLWLIRRHLAAVEWHPMSPTTADVPRRRDTPLVTDGPFAETREQLGGPRVGQPDRAPFAPQ